MKGSRSFLLETLSVRPGDDGLVSVTVQLPHELVTEYCRFIDSLAGFFKAVDSKSYLVNLSKPETLQKRKELAGSVRSAFRVRIVLMFDDYTSSGLTRQEAIKRVSADLRAEDHPWSADYLVRSELIAAGRPGVPGRPRRTPGADRG